MKLLYITVPSFFDLEISLIRELSKSVDVSVVMFVTSRNRKSSAFSVEDMPSEARVFCFNEIDELSKYKGLVNLDQWYVANCPTNGAGDVINVYNSLRRFVKQGGYDFVHCSNDNIMLFLMSWSYRHIKNKLLTVHDPITHSVISKVKHWYYGICYSWYRNLLFLNTTDVDAFHKLYPSRKLRLFHSRLGVYDFLDSFPITDNPYGKYILFTGRIQPYKGVDDLVAAYAISGLSKTGIKLVIAGKGEFGEIPTDEKESIIVLNRYIENDELANLIRHAMYVVLPYRSATQSGVVMSALALDKPLLVTNVGDLPTSVIASDGSPLGLVVEPNDITALSEALVSMCSDSQALKTFVDNICKARQSDPKLSWSAIADGVVKIYGKIAETPNK